MLMSGRIYCEGRGGTGYVDGANEYESQGGPQRCGPDLYMMVDQESGFSSCN